MSVYVHFNQIYLISPFVGDDFHLLFGSMSKEQQNIAFASKLHISGSAPCAAAS